MTSLSDLHQHGPDPAPTPSPENVLGATTGPEPAPGVASRILDVVMVAARAPVILGLVLPLALILEVFKFAGVWAEKGLEHLEDFHHALVMALHPRAWKRLRESGPRIYQLQCGEAFWKDTAERLRKENEILRRPAPEPTPAQERVVLRSTDVLG